MKIDDIVQFATTHLDEVVQGQPLNLDEVVEEEAFIRCSLHCIINGPVGVAKENAFQGLFDGSIRDMFGCRTSQWRETCRLIANQLITVEGLVGKSNYARLHGNLWPLA